MSNQSVVNCPLCTEEMDSTDLQLKPCKCGYQVLKNTILAIYHYAGLILDFCVFNNYPLYLKLIGTDSSFCFN